MIRTRTSVAIASLASPLRYGVRFQSTAVKSYFDLFPQSFPGGGPPKDSFKLSAKALRREFRTLQSQHHPDIQVLNPTLSKTQNGDYSSLLNKSYSSLINPYSRIAHIIELQHPKHPDITLDEVSKKVIEMFQADPEHSLEYKDMLMTVLDAHELLEFASKEEELDSLSDENDSRIAEAEETVDQLLQQNPIDWYAVMLEAIRLKYWVNIQSGIRDWEPGKPVHLTH